MKERRGMGVEAGCRKVGEGWGRGEDCRCMGGREGDGCRIWFVCCLTS